MYKKCVFIVCLVIIGVLFSQCEKDDTDATDQFTGSYFYTLTSTMFSDTVMGTMLISKKYENRVSMVLEGFPAQTAYTVQDNLMIQDSYQYQYFTFFNNGVYIPFLQGGQGIIKESRLIIKGTWFYKYAGSYDFKIVATKVN